MEFKRTEFTVDKILEMFERKMLVPNPEYQRGATWDPYQQRALIDSLFRKYPIPPLFLLKNRFELEPDEITTSYEIVDGQQRIIAISDFFKGKFALFQIDDKKFKIPNSLRALPRQWAGKIFSELPGELRTFFTEFRIDVQLIQKAENKDEVRDLFIRLQAGTALTPQQVRDAWPGNIGPFVERLAGKLTRPPEFQIFELIDRRGTDSSSDDQKDRYVDYRNTCAQLLRTFLARTFDALNFVSVSSRHLDALYHENTEFACDGQTATAFRDVLALAQRVLQLARDSGDRNVGAKKGKFRKVNVICLVAFLQDMRTNPNVRIDSTTLKRLADFILIYKDSFGGKKTSGAALAECYKGFVHALPPDLVIRTDPQRLFNDEQKREIRLRDDGKCQRCGEDVMDGDEEFDHFPISHRRGGSTKVENGRLVHSWCHPRDGRPVEQTLKRELQMEACYVS
jgi:hypothetical protein